MKIKTLEIGALCCSMIISIRCTALRKAHFEGNWPPSVLEKMADKLLWILFPLFVAHRSNWQLSFPPLYLYALI